MLSEISHNQLELMGNMIGKIDRFLGIYSKHWCLGDIVWHTSPAMLDRRKWLSSHRD